MIKIGLLSDTHGYIDRRMIEILSNCDEIWHAGDIGSLTVLDELKKTKPTRAVYGNIDGTEIRKETSSHLRFIIEEMDVFITHIAGYPGKYERSIKEILKINSPGLLICGHSHILRIMHDPIHNMMYMNPGAAGKYGFHNKRTLALFEINKNILQNLRIVEWDKNLL